MTLQPDTTSQPSRQLQLVRSLVELRREKWVPFTLAPVYVHARVPFDIIQRFCDETNIKPDVYYVDFEFQIINEPPPYHAKLFVMNDKVYYRFCDYLLSIEIFDRKTSSFGMLRHVSAAIMDPFMKYIGAKTPVPELIDIWTISTMRGHLLPLTHAETLPYPIFKEGEAEELTRAEFLRRLPRPTTAPDSVIMSWHEPEPSVIILGRQRLKELG
jgi:hypothetical protein